MFRNPQELQSNLVGWHFPGAEIKGRDQSVILIVCVFFIAAHCLLTARFSAS
jgi:hypothetical protein